VSWSLPRSPQNTVTACCFNWRYAPAYQITQNAIRSGQVGAIRDMRTESYFRVRSQFSRDHFASPTPGTVVVGQRHDDHEPVELEIANLDKVVVSTDLLQHTSESPHRGLHRRDA